MQGLLHQHLRHPPVFQVQFDHHARLRLHVQAGATQGGALECRIDDRLTDTVALPILDGKNDSGAREYDRVVDFRIPAGRHRVALANSGAGWLVLTWLQFEL